MDRTDAPEITWTVLSDAGIDLDNVHRNRDDTHAEQYEAISGTIRIAFGEQPDPEHILDADEHPGWAYTAYDNGEQDETKFFEPGQLTDMLAEIAAMLA
jgi:hypothetical protein